MQRINTLLQKMAEISQRGEKNTAIDLDLMLDYTRVLYADVLEWRGRLVFNSSLETTLDIPAVEAMHQRQNELPVINKAAGNSTEEKSVNVQSVVTETPKPTLQASAGKTRDDIRKSIGINDKYQLISELFGNNKDAYEQVLSQINMFDNSQQAINWLKVQMSKQFDWDEEHEAVQLLHSILNNYYSDNY